MGVLSGVLFYVCFTLALAVTHARGEVITLMAAADTSLFESQPDFNLGAQEDIPSGTLGAVALTRRSRVLLSFDLAGSLPSNAVIRSVSLRLHVTRVPDGGGLNSSFALHRVLRPWGEGRKSGSPPGGAKAGGGEATWNARFFPDELWGKPGGEPGVDYAAESSSSERILQTGMYEFEFGPKQVEEISHWLREPKANFGWILISRAENETGTARRFASREHPASEMRPALVVEFTPARAINAPRIIGISLEANGTAVTRFIAEAGVRYRLEFTDDFPVGVWQSATELVVAIKGGEMSLEDALPVVARRFYRVVATE